MASIFYQELWHNINFNGSKNVAILLTFLEKCCQNVATFKQ